MKAKELLELIPDEHLEVLAAESRVDFQVKKLSGKTIFQLILFSLLNAERVSLRVMEDLFHSMQFRMIADTGKTVVEGDVEVEVSISGPGLSPCTRKAVTRLMASQVTRATNTIPRREHCLMAYFMQRKMAPYQ
jgi:hypothetical protein